MRKEIELANLGGKRHHNQSLGEHGRGKRYVPKESRPCQKRISSEQVAVETPVVVEAPKEDEGRMLEFLERMESVAEALEKIETTAILPIEERAHFIDSLVPLFHRDWQKHSGFTDRWRKFSKDQYRPGEEERDDELWARLSCEGRYVRMKDGVREIDIQNVDPEDLSLKWVEENRASAVFVVDTFLINGTSVDLLNLPEFLHLGGASVHERWLIRNGDATGEQAWKFSKMGRKEQDKDIALPVIAFEEYVKWRTTK